MSPSALCQDYDAYKVAGGEGGLPGDIMHLQGLHLDQFLFFSIGS